MRKQDKKQRARELDLSSRSLRNIFFNLKDMPEHIFLEEFIFLRRDITCLLFMRLLILTNRSTSLAARINIATNNFIS